MCLLLLVSIFANSSFRIPYISAQLDDSVLQQLQQEIEEYQRQIDRLRSEANTLSNQIAQYDTQIKLKELKIIETEEKILRLSGRIDQIQLSLDSLTNAFSNRASETYKMARLGDPMLMILTAPDISGIVSSFHYIKKVQEADRDLLIKLEEVQVDYTEEKEDHEELQVELEEQKKSLNSQKAVKNNLLALTKSDEQKYQDLLAAAKAEYEAIQAIIAGKGVEVEVGNVSEGERIASIIQGASCNSSAAHLHFMVVQNDTALNPFEHLRGGVDFENCSGSSCGSGDGDAFNPSGSWNWPIDQKIRFTQGYGHTWAISNTWVGKIYNYHNGIDVVSDTSNDVKAVRSGRLYRGSYVGYNGCSLKYVRVDHHEDDKDTFYLHINY